MQQQPHYCNKPPTTVDVDRSVAQSSISRRCQTRPTRSRSPQMIYERMEEHLVLVEEYGSAHAKKSKLLHGIQFEIIATLGMSTSIDAAAAERFAIALRDAKQTCCSIVCSSVRAQLAQYLGSRCQHRDPLSGAVQASAGASLRNDCTAGF